MSIIPKYYKESHSKMGSKLRDFILGWQDGLVNVLGLVLGIASATQSTKLILISGLVAASAEAISMAAVAYTSTKAELDFYKSELEREKRETKEMPDIERKEIRDIYARRGFSGSLLDAIVKKVTLNKRIWVENMMEDELKLSPVKDKPLDAAAVVFAASIVAAIIPLIPFVFFPVFTAIIYTLAISVVTLFIAGAIEAKITIGNWEKRGAEMAVIGMLAALLGYLIGKLLGGITV
jgi:VIT1/CCC1 family predicted Fe2+/Mn2+ transporter